MTKQHIKISSGTIWVVGVTLVLVGLSIWVHKSARNPATVLIASGTLAGIQTGQAPWPAEIANLRARLDAIHLPALTAEGSALHIHQHLDIYIEGKNIPVPSEIGVNESAGFISEIHTHDTSGIIHVESPRVQAYTLGQFFDIWGVRFAGNEIGGYVTHGDKSLRVYVNGALYTDDPRQLVLAAHQEIVIAYGTDAELPMPIPTSYQFGDGL